MKTKMDIHKTQVEYYKKIITIYHRNLRKIKQQNKKSRSYI